MFYNDFSLSHGKPSHLPLVKIGNELGKYFKCWFIFVL